MNARFSSVKRIFACLEFVWPRHVTGGGVGGSDASVRSVWNALSVTSFCPEGFGLGDCLAQFVEAAADVTDLFPHSIDASVQIVESVNRPLAEIRHGRRF
jgi:hypothetical protein